MRLIKKSPLNNLKILHLGNIANNAYLNSKFLRKLGVESDVISHDYYDPMSTPEWEDSALPKWYISGSLQKIASKKFSYENGFSPYPYLIKKTSKNPKIQNIYYQINKKWINFCKKTNPHWQTITLNEYLYWTKLTKLFVKFFPEREDGLKIESIIPYSQDVRAFKKIFSSYDIIQGYGTEPIYALLAKKRPYIAFEHGTIRDIPFENSPRGRLTALAYKLADQVIITNPDNILAAKRLKLENFIYVPHPLDEQKIINYQAKINLKKKYQAKILFFSPTRHNWRIKGNDLIIKGFSQFIKNNSPIQAKLILSQWGQEVEKSKRLINKLKIAGKVIWTLPLEKYSLIEHYKNSDVILDQFKGYFGTVAPEAMAAAKPVIMWFEKDLYRWAFREMPPVILANTSSEIASHLVQLVNNQKIALKYGQNSQKWITKYHSQKVVTEKLIKIYEKF